MARCGSLHGRVPKSMARKSIQAGTGDLRRAAGSLRQTDRNDHDDGQCCWEAALSIDTPVVQDLACGKRLQAVQRRRSPARLNSGVSSSNDAGYGPISVMARGAPEPLLRYRCRPHTGVEVGSMSGPAALLVRTKFHHGISQTRRLRVTSAGVSRVRTACTCPRHTHAYTLGGRRHDRNPYCKAV